MRLNLESSKHVIAHRSQYEAESVASLRQLSDFLEAEAAQTTVFLRLHDNSARMIDQLQKFMTADETFTQRTVVISRSPLAIYQVGESHLMTPFQELTICVFF